MAGEAIIAVRDKQWLVSLTSFPWELKFRRGVGDPPSGIGLVLDMGGEQIIEVTTLPMLYCLDVAFLSESLVIVELYRNVSPGSQVASTLPVRYFFEVSSGDFQDIDTGDRVTLELLPS